MNIAREKDIEQLRKAALVLAAENQRLVTKVTELTKQLLKAQGKDAEELQLRISELEQQLAARNKELFGQSSEKRSRSRSAKEKAPQTGHGPRQQPLLDVVEVPPFELDAADRACKSCGGQLDEWDGKSDDSEEVDVIERRFVLRKIKRKKYRCKCGACIETAPGPLKLVPGGRYSMNFSIAVALAKYLDHLPLERQVRAMLRDGLAVDSQTLFDQCQAVATKLKAAYEKLHAYINVRAVGDRPLVVPRRSKNLAFISQFAELEYDMVFTEQYSVRCAQVAVYKFLGIPEAKLTPRNKYDRDPARSPRLR